MLEIDADNFEAIVTRLNPFKLPSVPLRYRGKLPAICGIYFAINHEEKISYIGSSTNIRQRLQSHHRVTQLQECADVRIAYLGVDSPQLLLKAEKDLLKRFNPPLNGSPIPKSSEKSKTKRSELARRLWKQYQILKSYKKVGDAQNPPMLDGKVQYILRTEGYLEHRPGVKGRPPKPCPPCPKCGSAETRLRGLDRYKDRQCYLCTGCNRTWTGGKIITIVLSDAIANRLDSEPNPSEVIEEALNRLWGVGNLDKNSIEHQVWCKP